MEEKIELHKVRDFSGVFSDAVNFIKQNFRGIGKSLVVIVAPVYTLATVLVSFLSVRIIDAMNGMANTYSPYGNAYGRGMLALFSDPALWLSILVYFSAFILAFSVIFAYIKLYNEKELHETITPNEVWQYTWRKSLKFLGYSIVYTIIFMIAYFLLMLVLTLIGFVPIIGPIIMVFVLLGLFVGVYTFFTVLVPVIYYEDEGIIESLSRTVSLLKGSFWQTLLINMVAYIMVQAVAWGFYFVFMMLFMTGSIGMEKFDIDTLKIIFIIFFALTPIALFFAYLFQYSISSFNYFSLLEKRDHVGLKKKVNAINEGDLDKPTEEF